MRREAWTVEIGSILRSESDWGDESQTNFIWGNLAGANCTSPPLTPCEPNQEDTGLPTNCLGGGGQREWSAHMHLQTKQ